MFESRRYVCSNDSILQAKTNAKIIGSLQWIFREEILISKLKNFKYFNGYIESQWNEYFNCGGCLTYLFRTWLIVTLAMIWSWNTIISGFSLFVRSKLINRTCDIDRCRERTCTRQTFGVKNLLFLSNECRLIVLNVLFHDNVEADTRPSNVKMLHND